MSDTKWILLTDGYYIKLLYMEGEPATLHTYREADFEKSSDITYNLITRYKKSNSDGMQDESFTELRDSPHFALKLISRFLEEKYQENSFKSLVIIAPQSVHEVLEEHMPSALIQVVEHKITGDLLNLPQDQLQDFLANEVLKAG